MNRITSILLLLAVTFSVWAQRPIEFTDMFSMGRVADPQISPAGDWIAYTVAYYNIEDNSKNSDIFLVSTDGKRRKQLTASPKTDTHPRWLQDGHTLTFISTRDGAAQIYRIDANGGEARKVTDIATGVDGFRLSPDGKNFAVQTTLFPAAKTPEASAKMDAAKAQDLATGRVIDGLLYRHWNEWRDGKMSRVVIVPVNGGEVVSATPADRDCPPIALGSGHDFVWSPDGQSLCFVQNTEANVAASTNNDLWLASRDGSGARQITANKGNDNGPRFSPDGKFIAYMSMARAGFEADQQDLLVYDLTTGKTRNLTAALDRYVSDFVWSPKGDRLYFYTPHHGRHRLYQVNANGGKPKLLLDKKYIGDLRISPDGKFLALKIQKSNMPNEIFRFDLRAKKLTRLTHTNDARLAQLKMNDIEDYWFIGAKGDSIHLLMVKPPNFDPRKKYPLISLVHGGPQGAWGDDFHYRWNSQMFAAPGYVAIMINFHGSRGYGQAFCDAVTRDWGGAPFEDVITGTKWAIEQFDFIDGERVGAAGASYGGFMLNWIQGHNDEGLFKTLVSHDGVYEQVSMFGATEELWFPMWEFNGTPWQEGNLYQKWNPANYVDHFKTPMLIIHGERDYRVPYTQGLQLFTALQMKGVPSRLLLFPDEDHFVRKPQNARQWWHTVHDWLARFLQPMAE